MIRIICRLRGIKIDYKMAEWRGQQLMKCTPYANWDLGVKLTSDLQMKTLNKTYRKKNSSTDVLSFPLHEAVKPGQLIAPPIEDEMNDLGDIIVSLPYVARYCKENDLNFHRRLDVLLVHGVCHLMGFDHEIDEKNAEIMQNEEERIMKSWQNRMKNKANDCSWIKVDEDLFDINGGGRKKKKDDDGK